MNKYLTNAILLAGRPAIARACRVSPQAVRRWEKAGRLPRTEWTGETDYSSKIEFLTGGAVKKKDLLLLE